MGEIFITDSEKKKISAETLQIEKGRGQRLINSHSPGDGSFQIRRVTY